MMPLIKTHKITRIFLRAAVEIPRAIVRIGAVVLIISMLSVYYPANPVSTHAKESSIYNYIYVNGVVPLLRSGMGQKIPVFIQSSVEEISKGIEETGIISQYEKLKAIGYIRFRYETKSNSEINGMAAKIVGSETDDRKRAYLLYEWIGKNIVYDWEKYNNLVNGINSKDKFGAVPAFTTRKGICEDYSDLYVAMARAVGLKVRIIVGQGYSMGAWGGHAWNEVYIPSEKRWIPLDATWARSGDYFGSSDFYNDHEFEAVAGEW